MSAPDDATQAVPDDVEFDPTDPVYWNDPKFRIVAPDMPPSSKLSCPNCSGTAYSDGAGSWICSGCRTPVA